VDLILFEKYGEIDIDENPLIFLSCGHFYTVSSLDGIMELGQHYVTDPKTGEVVSPKALPRIMASETTAKGCPECRMSLRDINRYNRIVKRALLDESTRKFVAFASTKLVELSDSIQDKETQFENDKLAFMVEWSRANGREKSVDQVNDSIRTFQTEMIRLLQAVDRFTKSVTKEEQPFGRVNNLIKAAAAKERNAKQAETFEFDESLIQTGFQHRAKCLTLRLNWTLVWNLHEIYSNPSIDFRVGAALRDAVASRVKGLPKVCQTLINACKNAKFLQQEAEARIYFVLFTTLVLRNANARLEPAPEAAVAEQQAREQLEELDMLRLVHPGTLAYLKDDMKKARELLNGDDFYSFVTSEEKREVYRAMAAQFSGTGHWYYCENNHPVSGNFYLMFRDMC
jgi:hypothetical protein